MRASSEGLSIRAAVFLGFGLIFGLWLFAWFQMSLRITEAQRQETEINARYTQAEDTLSIIRTQVLTGSVVLRDALLDPDPRRVDDYRRQLVQGYRSLDDLFARYVPVSDSPMEQQQFERLREEVDAFRSTMVEVLATDSASWRAEAGTLLSLRITPKRDIVMAVSESVHALNRSAFMRRQAETAGIYRAVQRGMWQLLGLALAISVAVAVLAIVYAGRLEGRIRQQVAKAFGLTSELQQLSERLVTAQEQERRHIARELHDEVGQALTAIKVELACAQRVIDDIAGPANLLEEVRSITDGALNQVRDLSYLLHPAALDMLGLPAAVDSFTRSFAKRYNIDVKLTHEGMEARLSSEAETAAYRIIQEALTNVARHAHASVCRVHLAYAGESINIAVEDNGTGFDLAVAMSAAGKSLGLIGIRERAFHLGGTARFDSAPGRGTRLTVELPAPRQPPADEFAPLPDPTAA